MPYLDNMIQLTSGIDIEIVDCVDQIKTSDSDTEDIKELEYREIKEGDVFNCK